MRSSEVAHLAGVTVRALRHYHQVGVLAEPERRRNGYREYGVSDLIRILRIKRLASLGIALERMPSLLDDTAGDATGLLADLDAELAAQIARLTEQRAIIAQILDEGAAPDVPPDLASAMKTLAVGASPDLVKFDRDQSVLLAHLAGEDSVPFLAELYQRLSESAHAAEVQAANERFVALGASSSESELDAAVEGLVSVLHTVREEFQDMQPDADLGASTDVFTEHSTELFNEQQRRVFAEVERRMSAAWVRVTAEAREIINGRMS